MSNFFQHLGRIVVKFRWPIVAAWIILTIASVAFLPSLSSVVKNDNRAFLPANAPSIKAAELASPFQNANNAQVVLVAQTNGSALTPADKQAYAKVEAAIAKVPTVISVKVAGVSPDQRAIQSAIVSTANPFASTGITTLVSNIRSAIASTPKPADLSVHLAGQVATSVDANKGTAAGPGKAQNYSIILVIAVLLLVFRALLAPLVTLLPAVFVVIAGGPVVAEASKAGFSVSFVTELLFIILIIGAGTDYGLFLVFRVREELRRGRGPKESVAFALAKVGESITFSAATVIAALLSLTTASFGFYKGLGWPLAIGIALMLLSGLTLLPALLAILGRAVFWPTKTHPGEARHGLWGRIAARVVSKPRATLAFGIILFGALSLASLGNSPAGFVGATNAPKGTDSYYGNQILDKQFPSSSFNPTEVIFKFDNSVWGNLPGLASLQSDLAKQSSFKAVFGPLNPLTTPLTPAQLSQLHSLLGAPNNLPAVEPANLNITPRIYEAYRSEFQFISKDGRTVLFATALSAGNAATTAALNATPTVRAQVASVAHAHGAAQYGVAGEAAAAYDISSSSNSDLVTIVPVVVLIIGLLLALVLRSAIAPLYLMISVVLSYLAALGTDVILFIFFRGDSGLNFVLPFLLFLFLLALGEDYNILVMTRIREEAHHRDLRSAVQTALSATGSTVTSAGLVLAGTFAVLALASLGNSQVEEIGFGLALGILMDTFLVRTLLVPSTVALLGKWNWWPSHLSHEAHTDAEAPAWEAEQDELAAADQDN